jgi:tetratricopeptide (TPR) repeat protein
LKITRWEKGGRELILPDNASPEELEEIGFKYVDEGKVKDGLKLILRAARKYEEMRKNANAAKLYRYIGDYIAKRTGTEKARPYLLKAAYLYIDLVEREIAKPDVDIDALDEYTLNVLEVFASTGDTSLIKKYAVRFGNVYEELGSSMEEIREFKGAIRAYESAFQYYKMGGSENEMKRVAGKLIDLYGTIAESRINSGDIKGAADSFYELSKYIRATLGPDAHYIEMMETAAKNYEKASKLAYAGGDLDGTTTNLVRAEYAYLLSGNLGRAKLVGINAIRILYQLIGTYRAQGDTKTLHRKLLELTEALLGVWKIEEAMATYREVVELGTGFGDRILIRVALLKAYTSKSQDYSLLDVVDIVEFYVKRGRAGRAYEILTKILEKNRELEGIAKKIYEAEGYY